MRFVTGGESGTYYAFGSVLAQHATNNAGIKVVGLVGAGSYSNVLELQDGNAELAFCQSDVMDYAYHGTNLFAEKGAVKSIRTVASLYMEQVQIVSVDPTIRTVADLRGKRVSVGAPGSGVYFNAVDVLGAYGMTLDDIRPTYQSFGDSSNDLKDGRIDAAFIVAGAPVTAIVDLSTVRSINLVAIDGEHMARLIEKSPYYSPCVIEKDVYGTGSDVPTVAVQAVILASERVSGDAVYAFVRDVFSDPASLVGSHAKYGELDLEFAAGVKGVPYHKGAAKFFREKGLTVEAE